VRPASALVVLAVLPIVAGRVAAEGFSPACVAPADGGALKGVAPGKAAAWLVVANVLRNLDATITKG
jgi:hypothetical protein